MPDAPPPAPAPVLPPAGDTVNVRIAWPHSTFSTGVEGVPDITTDFTAIPAGSLPEVQAAAAHAHIDLIEESA